MIYVRRNLNDIPQEIRNELMAASAALENLQDSNARKAFIADNANLWAKVRSYLAKMSYEKCWYSEAKEDVSRYQVDHFRPHGRAKQAPKNYTEGYCWLAFELENFRLAGMLCNTVNKEHSDESIGKGDWFPLTDPSRRATLANRDIGQEQPILLDPTDPDDPNLLEFRDDGSVSPSVDSTHPSYKAIEEAIKILGLNQNALKSARRRTWRDCISSIGTTRLISQKAKGNRTLEEQQIITAHFSSLRSRSRAEEKFAAVVRSCLTSNRLSNLIVRNELEPESAEAV